MSHTHDTNHFFDGSQLTTQHNAASLWKKPLEMEVVIQEWKSSLAYLKD